MRIGEKHYVQTSERKEREWREGRKAGRGNNRKKVRGKKKEIQKITKRFVYCLCNRRLTCAAFFNASTCACSFSFSLLTFSKSAAALESFHERRKESCLFLSHENNHTLNGQNLLQW